MRRNNNDKRRDVTKNLPIHGKEERNVLGRALNQLIDRRECGSKQGKRMAEVAKEISNRLPGVAEFETESPGTDGGLKFFDDREDSFKKTTASGFLGTRMSGDIRVKRVFEIDLDTLKVRLNVSYFFGDVEVEMPTRNLGRATGVLQHTSNPLAQAELNGTDLETYLRSIHMGSVQKDDKQVERILSENPDLRPHIWKNTQGTEHVAAGGGD